MLPTETETKSDLWYRLMNFDKKAGIWLGMPYIIIFFIQFHKQAIASFYIKT